MQSLTEIRKKFYPDFEVTGDNCHEEPIHQTIAIQGGTYMMIFSVKDSALVAVSENIDQMVTAESADFFGKTAKILMNNTVYRAYNDMNEDKIWYDDPVQVDFDGKNYNLIRSTHGDYHILEFEPIYDSISSFQPIRGIRNVLLSIEHIDDKEILYQKTANLIKSFTGYDRVMIYQFDSDMNGSVVGEAVSDDYESFLGLHYPASDIPKIARDLFLLNRSRIIGDIGKDVSWLSFNPQLTEISNIDLSLSQFRASSPVHIEYLQNMGVSATFNASIILNGKLWGLISCHHYSSRFINYEIRKSCEIIADELSKRILEINSQEYETDLSKKIERLELFSNKISTKSDVAVQLETLEENLTDLCNADGFCFYSPKFGNYSFGTTPSLSQIYELCDFLDSQGHSFFFSREISKDIPEKLKFDDRIGGVNFLSIQGDDRFYLLWFRKVESEDVFWGGDPTKPYEIDYQEDGQIQISPRKSFEKWKTTVEHRSLDWESSDVEITRRLKDALIHKSIKRQAAKAEMLSNQIEELIYTSSHNLQEPLRTISNYMELLFEELQDTDNADVEFVIKRTSLAANRMRELVQSMLDYSRLKASENNEWIHLNTMIDELKEDLGGLISERNAEIQTEALPSVFFDKMLVQQLFSNLITNAIKYTPNDRSPALQLSILKQSEFSILKVSDNGEGISDSDFDRIFMLFQRSDSAKDKEGTGIGLAHCKKIVESMGGEIWVTSKIGEGSTFHISINNDKIR